MKIIDAVIIFLSLIFLILSFLKVFLVFDYKRNYIYLDEVQTQINLLSSQNTKLKVEISLIQSSPYIYEKALEIGMIEPKINND